MAEPVNSPSIDTISAPLKSFVISLFAILSSPPLVVVRVNSEAVTTATPA